jgi:hypothetical protein
MQKNDSPPSPARLSSPPLNGETAQLQRGIFDPPEGFLFKALARHKRVVIVAAILGAFLGAAYGFLRPATYEAAATLQVGQVNPNSPGFASYTQSSSSLASAFSRAIAAAPVLASVKRKLRISEQRAAARLSAEPIALSPAFRVIATGPSASGAMRLANVAASGVIAYVNRSNSANPQARQLLGSYRRAALDFNDVSTEVDGLESGAPADAVLQAEARRSAARLRLKAIGNAYIATVGSQPPRTGFVSLLAGATTATGNRSAKIELYGLLGMLLGALAGVGASVLLERRKRPPPAPALRPRPS